MILGVTGESGFLGSHIASYAERRFGFEVVRFGNPLGLRSKKNLKIDTVIHCASVHRDPNPTKVYEINMDIHQSLIGLLSSNDQAPNIVMLSSIQENDGSPYGNSKKDGSLLIKEFCDLQNSNFLKFNLNNTFGPNSHPFKYSFVATFCYNIINDMPCEIVDRAIQLSYVDDVVDSILRGRIDGYEVFDTTILSVFEILTHFNKSFFQDGKIPLLQSKFEFYLFNTLLSFKGYDLNAKITQE